MKRLELMLLLVALFLGACQEDKQCLPEEVSQISQKEGLWMIKKVDNISTRAVADTAKTWKPGDTIRMKFLNENEHPTLPEKVKQYAAIWLEYANLKFEYVGVSEYADVKIGFNLDVRWMSWSTVGTDCKAIPQNEPSLNFFELELNDDEYTRGEVLRGIGHVLGLGFEHRSPKSPVVFNARARGYFQNTCQLSDQDIDDLTTLYNTDQTNYTEYDESSIMMLDIPKTILTTPKYTITSNTELSVHDMDFISSLYPGISIPQKNIEALNAHIRSQGGVYRVVVGINHDQNERIPFVAESRAQMWYGYVSQGKIYRKEYPYHVTEEYLDGLVYCQAYIFDDELYVSAPTGQIWGNSGSRLITYSLNDTTLSVNNVFYHECPTLKVPFIHNGKKYVIGTNRYPEFPPLKESLYLYNLTDNIATIKEFDTPWVVGIGTVYLYVKDGYIYIPIVQSDFLKSTFYKISVEEPTQIVKLGIIEADSGGIICCKQHPILYKDEYYVFLDNNNIISLENNFGDVLFSVNEASETYAVSCMNEVFKTHLKDDKNYYSLLKVLPE